MRFDISVLAALSRIQLTDEQKARLETDLVNILKYVEQINELSLEGVEPLSHVFNVEDVYRNDEVNEQPEIAPKVLEALPEASKNGPFFKVPKVVDKE